MTLDFCNSIDHRIDLINDASGSYSFIYLLLDDPKYVDSLSTACPVSEALKIGLVTAGCVAAVVLIIVVIVVLVVAR